MNKKLWCYVASLTVSISGFLGCLYGVVRIIAYAFGVLSAPEWLEIVTIIGTAVLFVVSLSEFLGAAYDYCQNKEEES